MFPPPGGVKVALVIIIRAIFCCMAAGMGFFGAFFQSFFAGTAVEHEHEDSAWPHSKMLFFCLEDVPKLRAWQPKQ